MTDKSKITPIFIFGLPRTGSTLLQKVIASHDDVMTTAEPWVLLPFMYALKEDGLFSEYSHAHGKRALQQFLEELPNGEEDYFEAVNLASISMYQKVMRNSDANFFLDKTPRYSLICDDIIRTFPEGRFIFLWRNPLSIVASILETWWEGKWSIYRYKIDLYKGLDTAIQTYMLHSEQCLAIQYEQFVEEPIKELGEIGVYLGIEFDKKVLENFSRISFEGKMGDPTGVKNYRSVSSHSLDKWRETICNPWRKWWCKRYLLWLGKERLEVMGYELNHLLAELKSVPFSLKFLISDMFISIYGLLYCVISPSILKQKWSNWRNHGSIVNHN